VKSVIDNFIFYIFIFYTEQRETKHCKCATLIETLLVASLFQGVI